MAPQGRFTEHRRARVAGSAAAIILLAAVMWFAGTSLLRGSASPVETTSATDSPQLPPTSQPPNTSSTTPSTAAGPASTTTTVPQDAGFSFAAPPGQAVSLLGRAPWEAPPLSGSAAPAVLAEEWDKAENREYCSALLPTELGDGGDGVPRRANFGGGWAIAWDRPDGPGSTGDGLWCPSCGRSAFGVAGVGLQPEEWLAFRQPILFVWDTGRAGYGHEGFDEANPKLLAEVVVDGQGCFYQVWSHLGPAHLEGLLTSLRFVDELQADPLPPDVEWPVMVIDGGEPPWSAAPIPADQVPDLLIEAWKEGSPGYPVERESALPLVFFDGIDELIPEATLRFARVGVWGVAWDNPDGPGHDGSNIDCGDCGRGAVLLGASPLGASEPWTSEPYGRIDYSDGSTALLGPFDGIPLELRRVVDPGTGENVASRRRALVVIPSLDVEIRVETHLGFDELLDLIERLRSVET